MFNEPEFCQWDLRLVLGVNMVLMINLMRILVRLVPNWKSFEIISRVLPPYLQSTVWTSHIVTRFWITLWIYICIHIYCPTCIMGQYIYEWVMSHNTCTNESCPTRHVHEWVMSHNTYMNESRRGKYVNESRLSHEWVMFLIWMSHVSLIWMSHIVNRVS